MQKPGQTAVDAGWVWVYPNGTEIPFDPSFWYSGEPNDGPDRAEDGRQDVGRIKKTNSTYGIFDSPSMWPSSHVGVCQYLKSKASLQHEEKATDDTIFRQLLV